MQLTRSGHSRWRPSQLILVFGGPQNRGATVRVITWFALNAFTFMATPRESVADVPSPVPSVSPLPSTRTLSSPRLASWPRNDYDEPPHITKQTKPIYPKKPFADGLQGTVEIEFVIDETGVVVDLNIVKSIPGLDEAALDCVKQWRFVPAKKAGQSVASVASAPVTFRITKRKR